ncbi:MAG: helix-turn-helix transcriptional regulator [Bdellovibrionota bacterium]
MNKPRSRDTGGELAIVSLRPGGPAISKSGVIAVSRDPLTWTKRALVRMKAPGKRKQKRDVAALIEEAMDPKTVALAIELTGLTQMELANKLGVHQSMISYWKNGKHFPDKEHFLALAKLVKR